MRITSGLLVEKSLSRLQNRLSSFEQAQARLSSGRTFEVASEDVNGMNSALSLRSERRSIDQAIKNAGDGSTRIDLADTKLQQSLATMRRIRDLAIRGASTLPGTELAAIGDEISSLNEQLATLANSSYLGQGLFNGTATDQAVSFVAGAWQYNGDNGAVNRRVSGNEVVKVNMTADDVFGFTTPEDAFTMVSRLEGLIRSGDTTGVANTISDVDGAMSSVSGALAQLGAAGNRIETSIERDLALSETIRRQLSSIEDIDLAEAVLEIQTEEVALQATMGAVARAMQPTLMDYMQ